MTGVFILLAFVLVVFIIGACAMIICYQRSKVRQRQEEKEAYEFVESQFADQPSPLNANAAPALGAFSTYNTHAHRY